jgi:hypothetical protein
MVVVPIVAVRMMVVAIVMMMMIAVPRCGWSRAADYNCAENA